jgi:hypothetical protein
MYRKHCYITETLKFFQYIHAHDILNDSTTSVNVEIPYVRTDLADFDLTNLPCRLRETKGVFVFGQPEVCVVAFGSKQFDIFALGDELTARNWKLNALQFPSR